MAQRLNGGCKCGMVRYECFADPIAVSFCYCRDCQMTSGGPFANYVVVPASAVKVTKGQAKGYSVKAESDRIVTREFCGDCGSPLFAKTVHVFAITAASFDDPGPLKPTMAIWLSSAQPWAPIPGNVERFPKNPPLTSGA